MRMVSGSAPHTNLDVEHTDAGLMVSDPTNNTTIIFTAESATIISAYHSDTFASFAERMNITYTLTYNNN